VEKFQEVTKVITHCVSAIPDNEPPRNVAGVEICDSEAV
jgi:hypothetical protein